jgi:hypothetical protein
VLTNLSNTQQHKDENVAIPASIQ